MAHSEKTKIWLLLKKSLPHLQAAGLNPIEFLIWTQGRSLEEVNKRINFVQKSKSPLEDTEDVSESNSEKYDMNGEDGFPIGDDFVRKIFSSR